MNFYFISGGKNHVNELRCDTLKRIKTTDNQQFSTKEHFHQLEADKCQSGNITLKSLDTSSFNGSSIADYEYERSLKEHKQYFIDHATNRRPCDPYAAINGDKLVNHSHEGFVTDYDDAISMNGDNDNVSSSGGTSGTPMNNNSDNNGRTNHRNVKRKHLNDNNDGGSGGSDNGNAIHKIYKNNCGDATAMMPNKFDYMNNFNGSIRTRSFDEMQNDEHQRMIEAAENEYRVGGVGAGPLSDDIVNGSRCTDDNNGNMINANYASSDDLNQTNTSEHDDKNMSGSDDESGGKL